jgi:uncharacterized protein (DUF849 family)
MSQIVEFPAPESRTYVYLEEQLRQILLARGADDALVEFTMASLTSVCDEMLAAESYRCQVALPSGLSADDTQLLEDAIEQALSGMRDIHQQVIVQLAARLILAEMKLFQFENTYTSGSPP